MEGQRTHDRDMCHTLKFGSGIIAQQHGASKIELRPAPQPGFSVDTTTLLVMSTDVQVPVLAEGVRIAAHCQCRPSRIVMTENTQSKPGCVRRWVGRWWWWSWTGRGSSLVPTAHAHYCLLVYASWGLQQPRFHTQRLLARQHACKMTPAGCYNADHTAALEMEGLGCARMPVMMQLHRAAGQAAPIASLQ